MFDPWQDRNFLFFLGTGIRRDGGAESQSLVSAPKHTWLKSAFIVKVYVLLIVIRLVWKTRKIPRKNGTGVTELNNIAGNCRDWRRWLPIL